jgi:hypothetical protein
VKPRFVIFIRDPEKERRGGGLVSLNRISSGTTEIKRWIQEQQMQFSLYIGVTGEECPSCGSSGSIQSSSAIFGSTDFFQK